MSDNLRDRIKEEVLDGILSMFSENDSVEMAAGYITDAVIRELGWREECRIDIGYGGYESEPSREQAQQRMAEIVEDWGDDPPETGAILQTRYVTEWTTDD
jgi:hypothetical protein